MVRNFYKKSSGTFLYNKSFVALTFFNDLCSFVSRGGSNSWFGFVDVYLTTQCFFLCPKITEGSLEKYSRSKIKQAYRSIQGYVVLIVLARIILNGKYSMFPVLKSYV